jgi:transposase InsO family protein
VKECTMTNHAIVWRFRRQVMLEAARLGNVSEACRRAGVSRTTYYRWLARYLAYGSEGLAPKQGRPPRGRQRLPLQSEQAVLAYALAHPTHGPQRIADELAGERYGALRVSRMSVWRLLRRRGLGRRSRRLAALEGFALGEQGLLCEGARRRVERHIEAQRPGELICLDSFYVGNLKGVGRIWQLTAIDAFSAVGWALLTVGELPAALVRLLEGRVLPDCAAAGHVPEHILTDNGNEYRSHLLAGFLAERGIAHRRTRVGRPQSNGFVERFQGTILHEFYRIAFRRVRYGSLAALQADLDVFVHDYNHHRAHHGYRTKGRRPIELFETATCNS